MENLKEIIREPEKKDAKRFIDIELGDSISTMTFREIADAVEESFELEDKDVADILMYDLSLDFRDDQSYKAALNIRECPCCHEEVKRSEMSFTRDCHGITFRLVCQNCWERLMAKGYDGEYYTEADEQIEDDY